ncbi:hypothetical protein DXG01_015631 [Tephrocybe rancida]|nr:hypothetical protein DXG01_015631 [Tephrocybe rancida]
MYRVLLLPLQAATACYAAALLDYPSVPLPLTSLFDNQAASPTGSSDFDGHGSSFDSQYLPRGAWKYDGINYDLPASWGTGSDNVIANSQVLTLAQTSLAHELHFLYSGDVSGGEFVANFVLNFADNSSQVIQMYARNWWKWPNLNNGAIQTPYHFENNGATKNFNSSQIYQWSTSVFSERALTSITFPPLGTSSPRLHIFAMSLTPSSQPTTPPKPVLSVRQARWTTRWQLIDGVRAQAVEVTLANLLPASSLSPATAVNAQVLVSIDGEGIRTVAPGEVYRLVPADQARLDVFVTGGRTGARATVRLRDVNGGDLGSSGGWEVVPLVERWTPDAALLKTHETPSWVGYNKILIAIPSDNNIAVERGQIWDLTYGEGVVYDDFIPGFTASKFNASEWVDVFDKAGAKYFVLVTKHHDGFALFDTGNTTHRSSVYLGPKRDLVSELFTAAKNEKPNLHRGTYYSLPEWFNPDSAPYGFDSWPGGLAHNAFNSSQLEPYTGRLEIKDYLDDLQLPQMLDLALKYETEIMWCDIGGPNRTLEFAADFYNHAWVQGRQVTINNSECPGTIEGWFANDAKGCGAVPDFDTPEYATFGSTQTQRWESNEGMDPFSYGLNSLTQPSQYKNGTTIVQTLVDIVSKNGNYLLDIGPTAEGEIIAPMMNNLLDAGAWLNYSGHCVYDTAYWFPSSQEVLSGQSIRFTTTPKTFCVIAFSQPSGGMLTVQKRLPILPGDSIRLLGPGGAGAPLSWSVDNETGTTSIVVSNGMVSEGRFEPSSSSPASPALLKPLEGLSFSEQRYQRHFPPIVEKLELLAMGVCYFEFVKF